MTLTAVIDFTDRSVLFREVHALVAGDLYNPLVLDFSSLPKATVDAIVTSNLTLVLKRSQGGATVASVPQFSTVPNHWSLRSASLALTTQAVKDWFAALESDAQTVDTTGWLEVSDGTVTYVACAVPVILRDITVRGDVSGYYTASQVDALLAEKQDDLVFDDSPAAGSSNPVKSSGLYTALNAKADAAATAAAIALKANSADVTTALAAKVGSAELAAAVAGKADTTSVNASLALKADAATVTEALAAKVSSDALATTLASYATKTYVDTQVAGFVTTSSLNSALASYATSASVTTALAAKADAAAMASALALKADQSALTAAVAGMVTETALNNALSGYATTSSVNTALAAKADLTAMNTALAAKADQSAVTTALAAKADSSDLEDLEDTVDAKADLSAMTTALAAKADQSAMTTALAAKADTTTVSALSTTVSGKADKTYVDDQLALKANAADVTTSLAAKADLSAMTTALEGKAATSVTSALRSDLDALTTTVNGIVTSGGITQAQLDAAIATRAALTDFNALTTTVNGKAATTYVDAQLALKANVSDMTTALAAKADASAMTTALAAKADSSTVSALATTVSGKADQTAVDSALALKASVSDMTTALAAKADASALSSYATVSAMNSALALKANAATTYTKTEVDSLISSSGGSGGQPDVRFLASSGTVELKTGTTLLATVRIVVRGTGGAVTRLVLEGAGSYAGTHTLRESNSWTSVSAAGGTITFVPATSSFTFSYEGNPTSVAATLPSSLGAQMSDIGDVTPTDGNDDRAVSSGGTYDYVEGRIATRVTTTLHNEDLVATRLITAQNATSAAQASRAAANNLALILDIEARYYAKAQVDQLLAGKAASFTALAPLSLSNGVLSFDSSSLSFVNGVQLNGTDLAKDSSTGKVNVQAVEGVQLNGADLAKSNGKVNVEAIEAVTLNGEEVEPDGGTVELEAVTGVQVNGTDVDVEDGVAKVEAVTGVQLNGSSLTRTNGVVNVQAITGVQVNGSAVSPTNGVVNIPVPSGGTWSFATKQLYGNSSENITLDAVNSVYVNNSAGNRLTIPSTDGATCRQFALCLRDIGNGGSIPAIYDAYTGNAARAKMYSDWTDSDMYTFITNRATCDTSDYTIRFYEIYPGMFTCFDVL